MSSSQPSLSTLNYLNVVAYAANAIITYGVGMGFFGTPTNGELSEKYQTIVTPVSWSFAIWGIIFIMQLVWTIVQLLPQFRASRLVREGVSWYYIAVCAAQAAWTLTFTFEWILPSLVAMLLDLLFLFLLVKSQYNIPHNSTQDFWLLRFPFSIHLGWIAAASLVNISLVLVKWEASGVVQFILGLISLVILLLVAGYCLKLAPPDFVVPSVLCWASLGIFAELGNPKDLIVNTFAAGQIATIRYGALVVCGLVLVAIAHVVLMKRRAGRHDSEEAAAYSEIPEK